MNVIQAVAAESTARIVWYNMVAQGRGQTFIPLMLLESIVSQNLIGYKLSNFVILVESHNFDLFLAVESDKNQNGIRSCS